MRAPPSTVAGNGRSVRTSKAKDTIGTVVDSGARFSEKSGVGVGPAPSSIPVAAPRRSRNAGGGGLGGGGSVIAQPGAEVSAEQLQSFGQQHLAAYKAPKRIYLARDFPRTKNGKILRREISPKIAVSTS